MNFKEDATRYPLFLYQVGLEMGHLERFWPESVPGGVGNGTPCTVIGQKRGYRHWKWDVGHVFRAEAWLLALEMGRWARFWPERALEGGC